MTDSRLTKNGRAKQTALLLFLFMFKIMPPATAQEDPPRFDRVLDLGYGLNKFDKRAETFSHYHYDPEETTSLSDADDVVSSIIQDKEDSNTLWIGTWGYGLSKFDNRPFEQVGDKASRADGTGLGLAISQQLVEAMGGTIEVKSELGVGSCFWFELALAVDEAVVADAPQQDSQIVGYERERRRILIVDDMVQNRRVLVDLLTPLGFKTEEAENGRLALEAAVADPPDLILTDLVMPKMGGLEAVAKMRQQPTLQQLPIIAISASVLERAQEQSLAAGCDAFLPKPVDADQLLALLATYLGVTWEIAPMYSEDQPNMSPSAALVAKLSEATLKQLYELAMMGDMLAIALRQPV